MCQTYTCTVFVDYRKDLEAVEAKLTFPKTIIAVVGDTGAGKSSLMNALLDYRSMLPTSGIRACTGVVVEVIQNTQSTDLEADIEFLQEKVNVFLSSLIQLMFIQSSS